MGHAIKTIENFQPRMNRAKQTGKTQYLWPDGTWQEISYRDYLDSTLSSTRIFWERLRFIVNRVRFLFANFKSIKVSKVADNFGKCKCSAKFRLRTYLDLKDVVEKAGTGPLFVGISTPINLNVEIESNP